MTPAPGEERAGMLRAYHVTLDALGAPPDEWPCNRVKTLVDSLRERLRAVELERDAKQVTIDLAFKQTEETLQQRDEAWAEFDGLQEKLTAAEQRVAGLEAGLEHARWFVPAKGSVMIGAETQAHLDGFYAALTPPPPAQEEAQ